MTKALQWLAENGDQLTVSGILAIVIVGIIWILYKKVFVPGWIYRECVEDRAKWEAKVEEAADRWEGKLDDLEAKYQTKLDSCETKISRLESEIDAYRRLDQARRQ